jgi:adenylate cyclase
VLIGHDAIIDKLIGDEVMALFIPGVAGATYRGRAAAAAIDLIENVTKDIQLPVGAAVDAGPAYMGNVGGEGVTDFTALGDPVNTAARLQATAAPGQVVLTADIYASLSEGYPGAEARTVNVRGREAPIPIQVLSVATAPV